MIKDGTCTRRCSVQPWVCFTKKPRQSPQQPQTTHTCTLEKISHLRLAFVKKCVPCFLKKTTKKMFVWGYFRIIFPRPQVPCHASFLCSIGNATTKMVYVNQYGRKCLLLNIEFKNESCFGHVNAGSKFDFLCKILRYDTFSAERNFTCCPCLLMSIMGPNVAMFTGTISDNITMDPACQSSLYFLCNNTPAVGRIASAFRAMKNCIGRLQQFYDVPHRCCFASLP